MKNDARRHRRIAVFATLACTIGGVVSIASHATDAQTTSTDRFGALACNEGSRRNVAEGTLPDGRRVKTYEQCIDGRWQKVTIIVGRRKVEEPRRATPIPFPSR
jgi:hypothetical protein